MSDNIPHFEMQAEIMKRLPIKSLIQFRSVSKQWKSLIDSPKFINDHTNHNQPHHHHHHLLVRYKLNSERKYISIIDDKNNNTSDSDSDSFPQQQFSVTPPLTIRLLRHAIVLGSSDNGLLCLFGVYRETKMVVLWNPSIRKSVGIPVPDMLYLPAGYTAVGFGVCPLTNDPKILKVTHINTSATASGFGTRLNANNHIPWEVEVFTLSSGLWRSIAVDMTRKPIALTLNQVVVDGVIYWHAFDNIDMDVGTCNLIVSFDLTSEEFKEVCIPDSFVHSENLSVCKLSDESLGVLDVFLEVEMPFCVVWMMERDVRKTFRKLFTLEAPNNLGFFRVQEFRKNGDPIMESIPDDEDSSTLQVYEHNSGRFKDLGINGNGGSLTSCSVTSYRETLLLLDKTDAIVHLSQ